MTLMYDGHQHKKRALELEDAQVEHEQVGHAHMMRQVVGVLNEQGLRKRVRLDGETCWIFEF